MSILDVPVDVGEWIPILRDFQLTTNVFHQSIGKHVQLPTTLNCLQRN